MKQHGFSLVELMIGITIGLLVMAGLTTLFANTSANRAEMDKAGRKIENGRYAASLLADELALAGYWGDYVLDESSVTFTRTELCQAVDVGLGLAGTASIPVAVSAYASWPGTSTACQPADYKSGTQVVVIRRLSTETTATGALSAADLYMQISNCSKDAVAFVAAHAPSASFTLRQKNCVTVTPARQVISRIYYIASCNVCSGSHADSLPTLKSFEISKNVLTSPAPLAEGVDDMQIDFALDRLDDAKKGLGDVGFLAPNGVADTSGIASGSIVDDCAASPKGYCWTNVVGASISVLARNTEPTTGYSDAGKTYNLGSRSVTIATGADAPYKRHVFSTTARLANVIGRREK